MALVLKRMFTNYLLLFEELAGPSCNCKKGCRRACGCRKSGLRCSVMCLQCNNFCENAPNENIGDLLQNNEGDANETNLELLGEEMDREEDSLEQSDDDSGDTEDTENLMDKRVIEEDLFLMSSPLKPLLAIFLYFYFIYNIGPKLMENRKPFELKWVLRVFNLIQILSNIFIVKEGISEIWNNMNWSCERINYSRDPHAIYLLKIYHLFFLTKVMDLLDTVFFVLRKRYHQITFLHVYHHFGMFVLMWLTVKFFGGGYGTWVGLINGFVHALMYVYYFLSSVDDKWKNSLTLKKFITQVQMMQFLTFVIIYGRLLFTDCGYPKLLSYFFVPQNFFMLILFANFYQKAYLKKKQSSK